MASFFDGLSGFSLKEILWYCWGGIGQSLFASRFFVQWICSERKKRSHIPISFWHLSLIGTTMMVVYSIHLKDPILIAGFGFGFIVYVRNIILIKRRKNELSGS